MTTLKHGIIPADLRDAIVAFYLKQLKINDSSSKYNVPSRALRTALDDLAAINKIREDSDQLPLVESNERKQIYRWASKYTGAKLLERESFTIIELRECLYNVISCKLSNIEAMEEYGVTKTTFYRYLKQILSILQIDSLKKAKNLYKLKQLSSTRVRSVLSNMEFKQKGFTPKLLPDEETLVIATAEMKCYASKPQQTKRLAAHVNSLLQAINTTDDINLRTDIKPRSKLQYVRRMMKRVMRREPDSESTNNGRKKKKTQTGEVKVAGLSHQRAKQVDPRLSWYMFHAICEMYRDAQKKQKEELKSMLDESGVTEEIETDVFGPKEVRTNECSSLMTTESLVVTHKPKQRERIVTTSDEAKKSMQELTVVPKDLEEIQPRADQVWNCDKIGIDPNGNWSCIVCTYKWCTLEKIWKTVEGEHAPFWVTILFYTCADGQFFVPPTIVHQGVEWTSDMGFGIPDNWVVHSTPSGYMDRDGFVKTCSNFCQLNGGTPTNPQFSFFDGHDSHWAPEALDIMAHSNTHPFFLKAGNSTRDQPNDNCPNCCLRACYNAAKDEWDEMFGNIKFNPPHFNSVFVKAWESFTTKAAPIVKSAFQKTGIHPLCAPSEMDAAMILGGACTAAM